MTFFVTPALRTLIDLALTEDIGNGDPTSEAIFQNHEQAVARLMVKSPLVLCGAPLIEPIVFRVDDTIDITLDKREGSFLFPGDCIATLKGCARSLLMIERTLLNFIQYLSGIATQTRELTALAGPGVRLTDTRKTLPGWRYLAKYAVRTGGGANHRLDLGGGIMIKDNHIDVAGSIDAAVKLVRKGAPHTLQIEVEARTEDEVKQAIAAGAHIVMLDNMPPPLMKTICGR
ncbi:carboxylating nicotinate-nucleotide diphosphorylase, partial [Myxococcota bacterium]|nr:carboxylating nicotinate-nucleotide diphosphorylase [Myxococcota bacterium]